VSFRLSVTLPSICLLSALLSISVPTSINLSFYQSICLLVCSPVLFTFLSVHLSVSDPTSIHLSFCQLICSLVCSPVCSHTIYLTFVCSSVCVCSFLFPQFIHLSLFLFFRLSLHPSIVCFMPVHLSVFTPIRLFICLFICIVFTSIRLFICY
jgi:hypothetical protein